MQPLPSKAATPDDLPGHPQERVLQVSRSDNRRLLEAFVQSRFREYYQADIHTFARHMIALVNAQDQPRAVIGYQSAAEGPLFLEQYLDQPIERALAAVSGEAVTRGEILEAGNLASRCSGSTRRLILSLIRPFHRQGYRWLVLTATPEVINSFGKLGIGLELTPLAPALPQRLQPHRDDWGSYYQHQPQVYAGRIHNGLQRLQQNRLLATLLARAPQPVDDGPIRLQPLSACVDGDAPTQP